MKKIRSVVVVTLLLTAACDSGGGDTEMRLLTGAVVNPLQALPMYAGGAFTTDQLVETAKLAGAKVCVLDAVPELCSNVTGADGAYTLELPKDGMNVKLYVEVEGAADLVTSYEAAEQEYRERDESGRNLYVVSKVWLSAAAIEAGLAEEGDPAAADKAIERGAGVIISEELPTVGTNYEMPKTIDVDATGPIEKLYAVKQDSSAPNGFTLEEIESNDADAVYPLPIAVYISTGAMESFTVTMRDTAAAQPLEYTTVTYTNKPGSVHLVRPKITNALSRFH